ncbi:MAG: Tat proofreading chaperone DmsD [Slackia sp.]|nr:Tat proofreading chaperone DmsD [Slackia sp.]
MDTMNTEYEQANRPSADERVGTDERMAGVAFIGAALSPFFLNDPSTGATDAALAVMAALDADAAAAEWPFVEAAEAQRCLTLLAEGAKRRESDGGDALKWEYRRLFVGPQSLPAPPWGSVYTDRDRVVFGEGTLALRAWMRAHGVQRLSDEKTPEDHIGLVLAMAGWLAEAKPELVAEFLQLHVLPWSGHLLEQLEAAAEHPFYKGLAAMANASLEGMKDAFGLEVAVPRFYR